MLTSDFRRRVTPWALTWSHRALVTILAFALGVVPLLAHLYVDRPLSPLFRAYGFNDWWGDLFCFYKDLAIVGCGSLSLAVLLVRWNLDPPRKVTWPLGALAALGGLVFLSWSQSPHRGIGLWGAPGTYEGVLVQAGYLSLAAAAANVDLKAKTVGLIVGALGFCLAAVSFLGLPEIFGFHPVMSDFPLRYLLGIGARSGVQIGRSSHTHATAMFGHSNYMGTYAAMMGPFFLTFAVTAPYRRWRTVSWGLSGLGWALLVGSYSRTGYVAGVAAALVLAILVSRSCIQRLSWWQLTKNVGITTVTAALVLGIFNKFGVSQNKRLFDRVQSIWKPLTAANPTPSFVGLDQDSLKIILEGHPIQLSRSPSGTIDLRTGDGVPVPPGYGGFEFNSRLFDGLPLLEIKRGALTIAAGLTSYGLRVASRQAFLKPENPAASPSFLSDDFLNRRGFIWKRTLPLILEAPWLGYGPGSFMLTYPNRDFTGFLNTFGLSEVLIDKPHNFYLQYAHAYGLPALGLMVWIFIYFISQSIGFLWSKDNLEKATYAPNHAGSKEAPLTLKSKHNLTMDTLWLFRASCLVGFIGFAVSGMANDSMSGVTMIAWIFLGFGLSTQGGDNQKL